MFTKHQTRLAGMTLIEMLVAISIFSVLMFVVMYTISQLYRSTDYAINQAYEVYEARNGMEQLVRDLREATFADDGTFPLAVIETDLVGFYSDIDRDLSVEYVEYEQTGTNFYKRIYNATNTIPAYDTSSPDVEQLVSDYVQNSTLGTSTFFYYDDSGNPVTASGNITDVRYIEVQIAINIDPVAQPDNFVLQNGVALRNIMNTP